MDKRNETDFEQSKSESAWATKVEERIKTGFIPYTRTFSERLDYSNHHFNEFANFRQSRFLSDVCFAGATFAKGADFAHCQFEGKADFFNSQFERMGYFWRSRFDKETNFTNSMFYPTKDGSYSQLYNGEANFSFVKFSDDAFFSRAKFFAPVFFCKTHFARKAFFDETDFHERVQFDGRKTKVQLSYHGFNNVPLLKEMLHAHIIYEGNEEYIETNEGRFPVYFMFSDFHSEEEFSERLMALDGFKDKPYAVEYLTKFWKYNSVEMFGEPEQVSFRAARFLKTEENEFLGWNINLNRKIKEAGIFISYKREDKIWVEGLYEKLQFLENDGIEVWKDWDIDAGEMWDAEIRTSIKKAKVAILFLSDRFFQSKYINEVELPALEQAQKNGIRIFLIPISNHQPQAKFLNETQYAHPPNEPLDKLSASELDIALKKIAAKVGACFKLSGH